MNFEHHALARFFAYATWPFRFGIIPLRHRFDCRQNLTYPFEWGQRERACRAACASFIPGESSLKQERCQVNAFSLITKNVRRRQSNRRGAAAVEFAIVATVFFMFVFAIFEIGRLVMLQQIMGEACRQGARRAILENANETTVETLVTTRLAANSIPGATVTISWPGQDTQPDITRLGFQDPITVRATVPYSTVSWLIPTWISQTAVMEAQSTMRIERPE